MERTSEGKQFTDIILEVFKLSGLLITEGDKLTEELGLNSARWKVLGALSHSTNPITVSNVARNMGLTRQAVQRIANEMVNDDFLYFQANPKDKRAKLLTITEKGKDIFNQLEKKQTLWVNSLADGLKTKDLELTSKVLKDMVACLQPYRLSKSEQR